MSVRIYNCRYCSLKNCDIKNKLKSYKIKEQVSYKCKDVKSKYEVGDVVQFNYGYYESTFKFNIQEDDDITLTGEIIGDFKKKMYLLKISLAEYNKIKHIYYIKGKCNAYHETIFNKDGSVEIIETSFFQIPVKESNFISVSTAKRKLNTLINKIDE